MNKTVKLKIKVVPGAARSSVAGWLGDMLKVRVSAPPEKGKANHAVIKLLAKELGVNKSALSIVSGSTSPQKVIEILGVTTQDIHRMFGVPEV